MTVVAIVTPYARTIVTGFSNITDTLQLINFATAEKLDNHFE